MNKSEKTKAIQKMLNIKQDGLLGPHTVDCMYRSFADADYPYHARFYGLDCFMANPDVILPFDPKLKPTRNFSNTISGSFSWIVNGTWQPISVLISNGKIVCATACHATDHNMPESVLWYQYDGTHGIDRVKHVNELPNLRKIKWAIGGLGLKKNNDRGYYDNVAEGFSRTAKYDFSDVLRKTSHIVIGFDKSSFVAILFRSNGIQSVRTYVDYMGLTDAIMLDGGHLTAANVGGFKYNVNTKQRYLIQLRG